MANVPLALLCVVPYHVLGMFGQYWHLSIPTLRGRTCPAWPQLSTLYVLHVRVLVTRGQSSGRAVLVATTEVPVTVPLHAWSGQGQSPVTISSQLVFGQDSLKSSASFDSLGALYDAQWTPKFRFGARKVSSAHLPIQNLN